MKKVGKAADIVSEQTVEQTNEKIKEALDTAPNVVIDANEVNAGTSETLAAEVDNGVEVIVDPADKEAFFTDPEENTGYVAQEDPGMTLHGKELYDGRGFDPAIQVKAKGKTEFEEDKISTAKVATVAGSGIASNKTAAPATEIDLENLDESMILNMPSIKAASFEIIDILNPKPKDKSIRFKWANYKNAVAGNLGRYKALGFEIASIDDVDQARSKIDPSMVDGTQVKYYDVLLLKINVIRLMSLYKANILKSVSKLSRVKEKGLAEANRTFQSSLSEIPGATTAYNKMKEALGGRSPVEFFDPGSSQ